MATGDQQMKVFSVTITRRAVTSVLVATGIGVLASMLALVACTFLAGAGHGTYLPAQFFYGPFWAWWQLHLAKPYAESHSLATFASLALALHGVYGGTIALARLRGCGTRALLVILTIHYAAVVWLFFISQEAVDLQAFGKTAIVFGMIFSVTVVELYVFLHVLAFQYARSAMPYRPRMTRRVYMILLAGIVAGVALHTYSVFSLPPSWRS